MKKKILFSLMTIALVGVLVGDGTHAYFSDVETSTGNVFTAGTLNLQVGAAGPCTENISIGPLKPGDTENAATWLTKNIGNIAGNLSINLSAIMNNENEVKEPETGIQVSLVSLVVFSR
jgi:predicted ribosomally synthesized peptide with SipW-like signal peptide